MEIKNDILWRVYLCFLGIVMLGVVVVGRAFYIQQVEGKYWASMGDSLHLKYFPIDAERGTIYSEDGNMLSTSVPVFPYTTAASKDRYRASLGNNKSAQFVCRPNSPIRSKKESIKNRSKSGLPLEGSTSNRRTWWPRALRPRQYCRKTVQCPPPVG